VRRHRCQRAALHEVATYFPSRTAAAGASQVEVSASGMTARLAGVSMMLGTTPLTVMPSCTDFPGERLGASCSPGSSGQKPGRGRSPSAVAPGSARRACRDALTTRDPIRTFARVMEMPIPGMPSARATWSRHCSPASIGEGNGTFSSLIFGVRLHGRQQLRLWRMSY